MSDRRVPIAVMFWDPDAPEDQELSVVVSPTGAGVMATLTDMELKVFAVEASLLLRKTFELPPSPKPV